VISRNATLALELEAADIGYRGAELALSGVDLKLTAGERVALLGGNGTGKTALLKTLVGLLPLRAGRLRIAGRSIDGVPRGAVEAGAGLVFQNPDDQLFGATVWEDAMFGPQNLGLAASVAAQRVERALEDLHITHLRERPVEALSFGEKKRACLAGVLAMQPSLLLLDEPTAGLDPQGELGFVELMLRVSGPGRATLVFATHAVDLVPLFADRVILLANQRIVADGAPHEVFRHTSLLEQACVRAPWLAALWLRLTVVDPRLHEPLPLTLAAAAESLRLR
jgi:cobalt/nickel transport system ATP-binding protein